MRSPTLKKTKEPVYNAKQFSNMKIRTSKQQKKHYGMEILLILTIGIFQIGNAQTIDEIVPKIETPKVATFQQPNIINSYNGINRPKTPNIYNPNLSTQQRNQLLIQQADQQIQQRRIQSRQLVQEAITEFENQPTEINYNLPPNPNIKGTSYYQKAFKEISEMEENEFSVKKVTFLIENAYHEEKENADAFNQIVKQTGKFLLQKMKEFKYDQNSNVAKNFILFQFFADTLQVKNKDLKHLPITYDFNDYMGKKDWSKMFVTKLLFSNKGQCNSMPRLYLILAEEIGAEAFLSLSPSHSYIRFKDEMNYWYNVELTNQMFTTNSMILRSGYVKSEALQNKVYMSNLTKKELLSLMLVDMANGYIRKFGYDVFVKQIIDKSLKLYPNGINANMLNANYLTYKFEYIAHKLGINPRIKKELQNIRFHPKAINLLNQVNAQYNKVDNLGFDPMPEEAYQNWLNSLKKAKETQESNEIKKTFKLKLNKFKD